MNQAIHGPFREAQRLVNLKLQQRDNGRVSRAAVMNLNQLGSRLIGTISQIDLQSLDAQMFERGLSARTIEYINAVLESALRQAVRWKMLAEDPCVGVDLPSVKHKEMEALSVEECPSFWN